MPVGNLRADKLALPRERTLNYSSKVHLHGITVRHVDMMRADANLSSCFLPPEWSLGVQINKESRNETRHHRERPRLGFGKHKLQAEVHELHL